MGSWADVEILFLEVARFCDREIWSKNLCEYIMIGSTVVPHQAANYNLARDDYCIVPSLSVISMSIVRLVQHYSDYSQ